MKIQCQIGFSRVICGFRNFVYDVRASRLAWEYILAPSRRLAAVSLRRQLQMDGFIFMRILML